jgi:hypothetical protein
MAGWFNSKTVKFMVVLVDRFCENAIIWKKKYMPNLRAKLDGLENLWNKKGTPA